MLAEPNLMTRRAPPPTTAVSFEHTSLLPEFACKTMFYEMQNKPEEREDKKDKQDEQKNKQALKKKSNERGRNGLRLVLWALFTWLCAGRSISVFSSSDRNLK